MKPKNTSQPIEDVPLDIWIKGRIEDIKYEENHKFTDKKTNETKERDACKIIMRLDGLNNLKETFWLAFSYDERSNLYGKFISQLVEGAVPYLDFDLDGLKGCYIKIMYEQKPNNKYPSIMSVKPLKEKVKIAPPAVEDSDPDESPLNDVSEEAPFL